MGYIRYNCTNKHARIFNIGTAQNLEKIIYIDNKPRFISTQDVKIKVLVCNDM